MGVYIILNRSKSTEDKLYIKIGCSKHCDKRYKEICSSYRFNGSDDELELMQVISVKQYRKLEKHLHILFNAYRCIGEYFKVTEDKLHEKLMCIQLKDYK